VRWFPTNWVIIINSFCTNITDACHQGDYWKGTKIVAWGVFTDGREEENLDVKKLMKRERQEMVWRTVSKINGLNLSIEKQLTQAITEMISLDSKHTFHVAMLILVTQKWTIFYFPWMEYICPWWTGEMNIERLFNNIN